MEVRYELPYDNEVEFWDPADLAEATNNETHTDDPSSNSKHQSAGSAGHQLIREETKNGAPDAATVIAIPTNGTESPEDGEVQAEIVKAK